MRNDPHVRTAQPICGGIRGGSEQFAAGVSAIHAGDTAAIAESVDLAIALRGGVERLARGYGMKKKRQSQKEIEAKLRQAERMALEGRRHSEIVRALRISAMTYHRWRKARTAAGQASAAAAGGPEAPSASLEIPTARARELELENQRLRRLVTDLLLEKLRLEEALQARKAGPERPTQTQSTPRGSAP